MELKRNDSSHDMTQLHALLMLIQLFSKFAAAVASENDISVLDLDFGKL